MKQVWKTIDRWGPGAIALVTLVVVLYYGGHQDGRAAGLEAQLAQSNEMQGALRGEVQTWQAYVVSLKEAMIRAGMHNLPEPPRPTVGSRPGVRPKTTTTGAR